MNKPIRILGIAGSLRRESYNRAALRAAAQLAPEGAAVEIFELDGMPYGESAWDGKPAAIMGASIGNIGTARAQYHLRQTMVFLNMFPLNQPEVMIGNAAERFDAQGNLADETTKDYIRKLLQSLIDWTGRIGTAHEAKGG